MKTYVNVVQGLVVEVIEPFLNDDGEYISIELRYAPEFVGGLIDVTDVVPKPEQGDTYIDGVFSKPKPNVPVISKEEIEVSRLVAYADPVYGSDRYFLEVMSLQAEGFAVSSTEVKEAKAKGLARKLEIQSLYPYPV